MFRVVSWCSAGLMYHVSRWSVRDVLRDPVTLASLPPAIAAADRWGSANSKCVLFVAATVTLSARFRSISLAPGRQRVVTRSPLGRHPVVTRSLTSRRLIE